MQADKKRTTGPALRCAALPGPPLHSAAPGSLACPACLLDVDLAPRRLALAILWPPSATAPITLPLSVTHPHARSNTRTRTLPLSHPLTRAHPRTPACTRTHTLATLGGSAQAAYECGANARALQYFETHVRAVRGGGALNPSAATSATYLDDEVSFLQASCLRTCGKGSAPTWPCMRAPR